MLRRINQTNPAIRNRPFSQVHDFKGFMVRSGDSLGSIGVKAVYFSFFTLSALLSPLNRP